MRSSRMLWSAACIALALTACEDNRSRATSDPAANNPGAQGQGQNQGQNQGHAANPAQRPAGGVEAVNDSPSRYYGKKLSLAGDVDEIYNDRAFELDGADWAFNDNITVLTKNPVTVEGSPLRSTDDIVVSGTVRPFAIADIEKEIGWKIPADLENKLNKRPVLVADTIHRTTGCGAWSASGGGETVSSVMSLLANNDMATFNGKKVDFVRERVQSVTGRGLWVGPSRMAQIFVLPAAENKNLKTGDWVNVSGTLAKTPKDAAKTWGLGAATAGGTTSNTPPSSTGGWVSEDLLYVDNATVIPAAPNGTPLQQGTTPGTNQGATPGMNPVNPQNPANPQNQGNPGTNR